MVHPVTIQTTRQGLHEITRQIADALARAESSLSTDRSGLVTAFVRHTSASLIIQENADPSARRDLESWLNRLVREGDPDFTHTAEGPDDMPSHVKAALTATSLSIPVIGGRLALGTWQGDLPLGAPHLPPFPGGVDPRGPLTVALGDSRRSCHPR